jgi:hypothetical protein
MTEFLAPWDGLRNRPHESPDCQCEDCTTFDVGVALAESWAEMDVLYERMKFEAWSIEWPPGDDDDA